MNSAIELLITLGNANDFYAKEKEAWGWLLSGVTTISKARLRKFKMSETCIGEAVYHLVAGLESAAMEFSTL